VQTPFSSIFVNRVAADQRVLLVVLSRSQQCSDSVPDFESTVLALGIAAGQMAWIVIGGANHSFLSPQPTAGSFQGALLLPFQSDVNGL
jgi:hypothetical protein